MIDAALPAAQQPRTYIGPEETTERNSLLKKVALFSVLLGSGLLLASFYTAIPFYIGVGMMALSAYALHYLCNIDSNIDFNGYPLNNAARNGNRCMLKFLLCLGANPNVWPGGSALMEAAERGHCEIVRDLLAAGADPNNTDGLSRTILMKTILANQDGAVEVLIDHGADQTIRARPLIDRSWLTGEYINIRRNAYEYAVDQREYYQDPNLFDSRRLEGDDRTRDQRKAAAERIVQMLRPIND